LRPLNFLLLDEPTTHLDIYAREALEEALQTYEGTLCLVSHDIEFVKAVANTIFYLTPDGITRYFGNYEYFRQKLAEEQALKEEAAAPAENAAAPVPTPTKQVPAESNVAVNRKQRKREEAMIRNEISKLKKPQEAIVLETEATMEALDQEQEEIYAALAEAKPDTDFAALNRRLIEIKKEMDHEATRWEEAADKLERLSAECEARIAELFF
jgi:ATP-binding cassette subfamily F protein 3